jgi:hypothetical protein
MAPMTFRREVPRSDISRTLQCTVAVRDGSSTAANFRGRHGGCSPVTGRPGGCGGASFSTGMAPPVPPCEMMAGPAALADAGAAAHRPRTGQRERRTTPLIADLPSYDPGMISLRENEQEHCSLSARHRPQTERQWWPTTEGRCYRLPAPLPRQRRSASAGLRWCGATVRRAPERGT